MEEQEIKRLTKYGKLYTLFERDKKFKVIDILNPKLDGITNIKEFIITEKIDGTNCGVVLTPDKQILIRKRSDVVEDDKQHHLYFEATNDVPFDKIKKYFEDSDALVIIFGEACGGNIQKVGQNYSLSPTFLVFDVKVGNSYLDWASLEKFCDEVGLKTVPRLSNRINISKKDLNIEGMKNLLLKYPKTNVKGGKGGDSEGVVVRSEPPLLNKFGTRMMFKIKFKDY